MQPSLVIPRRFEEKLSLERRIEAQIKLLIADLEPILKENNLFFFEEYTDHGIEHINRVLIAADEIIPEYTFNKKLTANDIATLIYAILLHDLGMHISFSSFSSLISDKDILIPEIDKYRWSILWNEYLGEVKKFSSDQNKAVFGNSDYIFREPDLQNKDNLTGSDKKLIGEFVRRHHTRIAHEIAIEGIKLNDHKIVEPLKDEQDILKKLAGIVARSHGMELRDTFSYLETISKSEWKEPLNIAVIYLMVILRIADYFQIDHTRTNRITFKLKSFVSPISLIEHQAHLSIDFVKESQDDPETLHVECRPTQAKMYVKLKNLFKDIQRELDLSWAVLGEIYGRFEIKPSIKYRRIKSNLNNETDYDFVPEVFAFNSSPNLTKLLIAPLYGDDPTFGVRELIQNAVDACREREFLEKEANNVNYTPKVDVHILHENEKFFFEICDNGKGMTIEEIKKYFLTAGSSLRNSYEWQKDFTNDNNQSLIYRVGKFGIGVLASFLLGNAITVSTRNIKDRSGYSFTTTLDDPNFEIKYFYNIGIGTSIKIEISEKIFSLLAYDIKLNSITETPYIDEDITSLIKKNEDYIKSLRSNTKYKPHRYLWQEQRDIIITNWYELEKPTIKFFTNTVQYEQSSQLVPSFEDNLPKEWHSTNHPKFKKIWWTYDNKYVHDRSLVLNGIKIPHPISIRSSLVHNTPKISLLDYDNLLQVSLDRKEITGDIIFKSGLISDIYKDIIAKILCSEVSTTYSSNSEIFFIRHPSYAKSILISTDSPLDIIFLENGFTFNNKYFLNKEITNDDLYLTLISNGTEPFFKNIYAKKNLYQNMPTKYRLFDGKVLEYENNIYKISYDYCYELKPFILIHPTNIYNRFKNRQQRHKLLRLVDEEIIQVHHLNNGYTCLTYDFSFVDYEETIIHLIESTVFESIFITEEKPAYFSKLNDDNFEKLINYYFENNRIIPYNIEERKIMFPKAFEELYEYMNKYIHS